MEVSDDQPKAAQGEPSERSYSLIALLLLVTLAVLGCGTFVISAELGQVVLLAVPFALLAARDAVRCKRAHGETPTSARMVAIFASAMAVSVAVGVSSGIAFFTFCGGWNARGEGVTIAQLGAVTGVCAGVIVGAAAFVWIARRRYDGKAH